MRNSFKFHPQKIEFWVECPPPTINQIWGWVYPPPPINQKRFIGGGLLNPSYRGRGVHSTPFMVGGSTQPHFWGEWPSSSLSDHLFNEKNNNNLPKISRSQISRHTKCYFHYLLLHTTPKSLNHRKNAKHHKIHNQKTKVEVG